jgi:excisionase family DNA binding protein
MEKRLLRIAEAAEALGLGRTVTYQLVMRGELPSVRVGRRRLVPTADLDRFIERLRADGEVRVK